MFGDYSSMMPQGQGSNISSQDMEKLNQMRRQNSLSQALMGMPMSNQSGAVSGLNNMLLGGMQGANMAGMFNRPQANTMLPNIQNPTPSVPNYGTMGNWNLGGGAYG